MRGIGRQTTGVENLWDERHASCLPFYDLMTGSVMKITSESRGSILSWSMESKKYGVYHTLVNLDAFNKQHSST